MTYTLPDPGRAATSEPSGPTEVELRRELAAVYRLVAHFGMTDLIFTHISLRIPGPEHHFLINPYGLFFEEITASSLVKVDLAGRPVSPTPYQVNPAGFVIHSAVHSARPDAMCVLHTHTKAGVGVAAQAGGLLPISQHALEFYERVGYHDYEGVALNRDEQRRLVADLGPHPALILRNHGLLTVGSTAAKALLRMLNLERACQIQIAAQAGGELVVPPADVCEHTARQLEGTAQDDLADEDADELACGALLRLAHRIAPDHVD